MLSGAQPPLGKLSRCIPRAVCPCAGQTQPDKLVPRILSYVYLKVWALQASCSLFLTLSPLRCVGSSSCGQEARAPQPPRPQCWTPCPRFCGRKRRF